MIQRPCPLGYYRNGEGVMFQTSNVPVLLKTLDDGNIVYRIYFPRPFLLVGLVNLNNLPTADPSYYQSYAELMTPAKHNDNADLFQSVFLDLAYATTEENTGLNPVAYAGKGMQSVDYLSYFTKFLNAESVVERSQWYNALIEPHSILKYFITHNNALTPDLWLERYLEVLKQLQNTYLRLWGAPGEYYFYQGQFTQTINLQTDYELLLEL